MNRFKILATAYDYLPNIGGISYSSDSILMELSKLSEVNLRVITRSDADERPFEMIRIPYEPHSWVASLKFAWKLRQEIHKNKPDVILHFIWWPEAVSSYLLSLLGLSKIPYFIFVHGKEILETKNSLKKIVRSWFSPIKKHIFRRSKGIIAVSQFSGHLVHSLLDIPKDKIKVIYHGVDSNHYSPGERLNSISGVSFEGKIVFLTVCRLDPFKGIDHMIRAMSKIYSQHPRLFYAVVGAGSDEQRLRKLAKEVGVENHVHFFGKVPFSDLVKFYQSSDCFVLLSREEWNEPNIEGFGISILEAAACEKPALVGNSGGMPEAISFGESGWGVDPNQIDAIANQIVYIMTHEEDRIRKGTKARRRVEEYFLWKRTVFELFRVLKGSF